MKKLHETKEAVKLLLHHAHGLEEKMGPILFQLPPGWPVNVERFSEFLKSLPRGLQFTFEFRNTTWYTPAIFELLNKYNCAFCIYQLNGHQSPLEVTADFIYVRLHGPGGKYQGSYSESDLQIWADRIKKWQMEGRSVYIYFDNDQAGYAAFNAKYLKSIISSGPEVTEPKLLSI